MENKIWTGIKKYSFDNRDYKNKKRILKHKKLLKDLFYKLAYEVLGHEGEKVKFRLSYKKFYRGNASRMKYKYYRATGKICFIGIKLDLDNLTKTVYFGYSNDYYKCRAKRLNNHVIGNRKNARLFVLYHELYHAKKLLNIGHNYYYKVSRFRKETEADIFALSKIKGA